MERAGLVLAKGTWDVAQTTDTVVLDLDARRRRRLKMEGVGGLSFLLDLAEVPSLQTGDALQLEDGRCVAVEAAPEDLVEITCHSPHEFTRVAWHLGNRHLPTQILDGALRIRSDHVIVDMVQRLGADVTPIKAPFEPEGGAYGHGHTRGHDHTGDRDHGHSHD